MVFRLFIESFLSPPNLDFIDHPKPGKNIEVSINGAKADAGQALSNHAIDLIGRWMRIRVLDLPEDYPPLGSHSKLHFERPTWHDVHNNDTDNYY